MQMYDEAMAAVHTHLIQKSPFASLTYTAELIPERDQKGQTCVLLAFA